MNKQLNRLLLVAVAAMTLTVPTVSAASMTVVYNSPSNPVVATPSLPTTGTTSAPSTSTPTTTSGSSTNWWTQNRTTTGTQGTGSTGTTNTGNTSTSTSTSLTAQEQLILNNLNQARQQAGLAPLTVDANLTKLARMKAQDIATNNYFAHTSPTYGTPDQMMRNAGLKFSAWAENIALAPNASRAYINFMTSTAHRANMMSSNLTNVGIGVVSYQGQYVAVAMEFTRPM